MRLLARVSALEDRLGGLARGSVGELIDAVKGMSTEELTSVTKNLLLVIPPPDDEAMGAIIGRAVAGGLESLNDAEWSALMAFIGDY